MAKRKAGLPDGDFELEVVKERPVQLGDFLDRELTPRSQELPTAEHPATTAGRHAVATPVEDNRPQVEEAQPSEQRRPDLQVLTSPSQEEEPAARTTSAKPPPRRKPVVATRRPPRKELTLDAESLRKTLDVISDISEQGPQADATATELVKALVQLAYDVRHLAEFSNLNPRGQWGSATAKAFIAEIKEAFVKAVGRYYIDRHAQEAHERLNANEVANSG